MSTVVYLAGPIDFADEEAELTSWRDMMRQVLAEGMYSCATYDPSAPFHCIGTTRPGHCAQFIDKVNMAALQEADVVVAMLPADTLTVGTPIEMYEAKRLGIPIVAISHHDREDSVYLSRLVRRRHFVGLEGFGREKVMDACRRAAAAVEHALNRRTILETAATRTDQEVA